MDINYVTFSPNITHLLIFIFITNLLKLTTLMNLPHHLKRLMENL